MAITIDYKPYNAEDIAELQEKLKKSKAPLNKVSSFGFTTMLDTNTLQHYYAITFRTSREVKDGQITKVAISVFNATFEGRPLLFETAEDCKSVVEILREKRKEQIAAIKKMKKKVGVK
jgi:hypothetical protein